VCVFVCVCACVALLCCMIRCLVYSRTHYDTGVCRTSLRDMRRALYSSDLGRFSTFLRKNDSSLLGICRGRKSWDHAPSILLFVPGVYGWHARCTTVRCATLLTTQCRWMAARDVGIHYVFDGFNRASTTLCLSSS
jgi:hypothetical protein